MEKTDGNPSSYPIDLCNDVKKLPTSFPAEMQQFSEDWSRFETVFARGMQYIGLFV